MHALEAKTSVQNGVGMMVLQVKAILFESLSFSLQCVFLLRFYLFISIHAIITFLLIFSVFSLTKVPAAPLLLADLAQSGSGETSLCK